MLDQNTDRMWYVIGAVIIGAAIILIMNNTFPQLFASVGNTFKDKTADVGKVVDDLTMTDGVGPVVRESLLTNGNFDEGLSGWIVNGKAAIATVDGRSAVKISEGAYSWENKTNGGGIYQMRVLDKTSRVKVTLDARAVSGSALGYVGFLNTPSSRLLQMTDKWETYTFTTASIEATNVNHNIFHMYYNNAEYYVDNVRIEPID